MQKQEKTVVGIDLGTTNTLVSYIKDGSPRIIPNPRGSRATPSVVCFKENGEVLVGELAKNQAVLNAERTISNVKLSMGKDREFFINGGRYAPADISSLILRHVKDYAGRYLGSEIEQAVITVPAYFDDRQRDDTLKAAEKSGLQVVKLLNEPTAAALTYSLSKNKGEKLLVIDFGGGTLDITLMEFQNRVYRVRGVGGSTAIGGTNIDALIVDYILKDFEDANDIDLSCDRIAYQQLVIHAEKAKIDLSSTDDSQIMIPYITVGKKGPVHLNMGLTRKTLEELIAPLLGQTESHIRQTFDTAGLAPEWVDAVILVGGSARIPAVEKLVRNILHSEKENRPPDNDIIRRNINPDEAVARGAGILAGIVEGSLTQIEFHDITPHDLGVEDDDGSFVTVMPRGTVYPTEASRMFTTTQDNQEEVCIHVMQNIGKHPEQHLSLGWFHLGIKTPKKKGETDIDVTFAIDTHGLLKVSAADLDSGEANDIVIETERMTDMNKGAPIPTGMPGSENLTNNNQKESDNGEETCKTGGSAHRHHNEN